MKLAPSLLIVALTACVDEPAAIDATPRSQDALDLAALDGAWIETSVDPGCSGCRLLHQLALVGDARLEDTISVRTPAGEACAMKRGYRFTGALVDYAFLASTCVWGPKGIVFEGFAQWTLDDDQLEVREADAPEGLAPTRWMRAQ